MNTRNTRLIGFAGLVFLFPPFPFIAHSLGWSMENMERNVAYVERSRQLREGAKGLVERAVEFSRVLLGMKSAAKIQRGGRKGQAMDKAAISRD